MVRTPEALAKRAAAQGRWRAKNVERARALNRASYQKNKPRQKNYALQWKYGITLEQWEQVVEAQQGLCAICCRWMFDNPKDCHLDHNHTTGELRELLCANCNQVLGHGMESPEVLRAAADYLERHLKGRA